MPDQAEELRSLVRQAVDARPILGPGLPIVVLTGGMTGVGTTTLAIQLARELARFGKTAMLVDANLDRPHLAERLRVASRGSLAEVLDGSRSAVEIIEQAGEGLYLLAGRVQNDTPADVGRVAVAKLLADLRGLRTHADLAIVDAGHGMSPWVQRWWRAAQQVFLVTTGAEAAVKKTYVALKHAPWGDADGKVRLVVNQCDDRTAAEGIGHRFARTCRRFLGLHIEEAPPIACMNVEQTAGGRAHNAYRESVRLLATEVVSSSVVVSSHIARRATNPRRRVAELLALPEFSLNSTNDPQSAPQE